jgi:hypothetical protein
MWGTGAATTASSGTSYSLHLHSGGALGSTGGVAERVNPSMTNVANGKKSGYMLSILAIK